MITKSFFTDINGQQVSVLGAERSGLGAACLLKKLGAIPFVSDFGSEVKLQASAERLQQEGIAYEFGGHSERLYDARFIIISPGVPAEAPPVKEAASRNIPVISELEFASLFCKGTVIAITGTNGKSTTTAFIQHLLAFAGHSCVAAGNIGKAFSEVVSDIPSDGFVSLEVSSFQLDHTMFFKPKVALILNITPDHLNRYHNDMNEYVQSKYRIFANQDAGDQLIINIDNEYLQPDSIKTGVRIRTFSLLLNAADGISIDDDLMKVVENGNEVFTFDASKLYIKGEHNRANTMAAILAVIPFIKDAAKLTEGLVSFKGIAHRMELVRTFSGVEYINDSKATNIDSVWYALRSIERPIYLILGGQDKGNDYNTIKELVLAKVKKIYAIGVSAEKIYSFFHNDVIVEIKESMEDCISSANKEARTGDVVLLSPACASFDMFRNFEHRGDVFREIVGRLN